MTEKLEGETKNEIIIDATNATLGRLASFAAKQAIYGKNVVIVNSEKAKIIGSPKIIIEDYLAKTRLGRAIQKGPLFSKEPAKILRRAIRGMLERKRAHGREALKRVKCYEGIPQNYINKDKISVGTKEAIKFITLEKLSKQLGK